MNQVDLFLLKHHMLLECSGQRKRGETPPLLSINITQKCEHMPLQKNNSSGKQSRAKPDFEILALNVLCVLEDQI